MAWLTHRQMLRGLRVVLALGFGGAGAMKVAGHAALAAAFVQFGYPGWFLYFVGGCEVLGAVGLLVPRTARAAAACLCVLMVGATVTQLVHNSVREALPAVVLALGTAVVASKRLPPPPGA